MCEVTGLFECDATRCVGCGACVRDCAFKALRQGEFGRPVLAAPEKCMRCQHCLAVCPTGAVRLDGKGAENCLVADQAELPTAAAVRNWLRLRRSVRQFRDEDVDPEVLESILQVLGNTPTGCNARSLTFSCFPNRRAMGRMRESFLEFVADPSKKPLSRWISVSVQRMDKDSGDLLFRGASGLLVVSSDSGNPAVTTPREDVTLACANFELLANASGIATCWCGYLGFVEREMPGLVEHLAGVPTGHPFAAMLFGFPNVRYPRGVARDGAARIVYR